MHPHVTYREAMAIAATLLTLLAALPYIVAILRRQIQPHVFSWIIWHAVALIAALAQSSSGAGPGAWPTYTGAASSLIIAALALRTTRALRIHPTDIAIFIGALLAIPVWRLTDNPLAASTLVTAIGLSAFAITFRKIWYAPFSENRLSYAVNALRFALAIAALDRLSLATIVFPLTSLAAHATAVVLITTRRAGIAK